MSITGILVAALIVGGTGLFIGVFLGVAGKKFAVEVDETEQAIHCRAITVADADTRDVQDLRQPLRKVGHHITAVRSEELR